MVGFRGFIGTGHGPVSIKLAVKMISVNGKMMIYDRSVNHFMARLIKKS